MTRKNNITKNERKKKATVTEERKTANWF